MRHDGEPRPSASDGEARVRERRRAEDVQRRGRERVQPERGEELPRGEGSVVVVSRQRGGARGSRLIDSSLGAGGEIRLRPSTYDAPEDLPRTATEYAQVRFRYRHAFVVCKRCSSFAYNFGFLITSRGNVLTFFMHFQMLAPGKTSTS